MGGSRRLCLGGLETLEKIQGLLCFGCSLEDCLVIALQNLEPALDVGGMVLAGYGGDAQGLAGEGRPQLSHQLFKGIALRAKAVLQLQTSEAGLVPRPVR